MAKFYKRSLSEFSKTLFNYITCGDILRQPPTVRSAVTLRLKGRIAAGIRVIESAYDECRDGAGTGT